MKRTIALIATLLFCGCGPFAGKSPTECESATNASLTGNIGDDIIGTWSGCLVNIDVQAPLCVFEPGGLLRLVYPVPSRKSYEEDPYFFEGAGHVVEQTYLIKNNQIVVVETGDTYLVESIASDRVTLAGDVRDYGGPALKTWSRRSCNGFGFED